MSRTRRALVRLGATGLGAGRLAQGSSATKIFRELSKDAPTVQGSLLDALAFAVDYVPFWRERLDPKADLLKQHRQLPVLTKSDIRAAGRSLQARDLSERKHWVNQSGGSTGQPLEVLYDQEFKDWSLATQKWYFQKYLATDLEAVPTVILWGSERDLMGVRESPIHRAANFMTQTLYLNSFRMNEKSMRDYCDQIRKHRPVYVRGYAGSLFELSEFALENGVDMFSPRFVYSAAETLTPAMRETIERAFKAPVYDFYGSREVGPMTGQIPGGELLSFSFFNLLEVVDEHGHPVEPGQSGRILVTALRNRAMPLFRYDIGDTGIVESYDSNGYVRSLRRISGRVSDHFVAPDGTLIHGEYFTHLFYGADEISEFQVVQLTGDTVEVRWVPAPATELSGSRVEQVDQGIRQVLGNCTITWVELTEIPLTPQGKRLFTISHVHHGRGSE